MSQRVVFDASAVLAFLQGEPGAEIVERMLPKGVISTVTYTEVVGKLVSKGIPANQAEDDFVQLGLEVVGFDQEVAQRAAHFYARRNPYNLSLGDCAVLALGEVLGLPILTGERRWARLPDLRVKLIFFRQA